MKTVRMRFALLIATFLIAPAVLHAATSSCLYKSWPSCYAAAGESYGGVPIDGNDEEAAVEAVAGHVFGEAVDLTLLQKIVPPHEGDFEVGKFSITSFENDPNYSFTWEYTGSSELFWLTVKAGSGFGLFNISESTGGLVSMKDQLVIEADITNFTFWTGNAAPVPEPGTMMLLGSGLVGLVGYGRRRFKK